MSEQDIRRFPQEVPDGAWPLFRPTQGERQYQPVSESDEAKARRISNQNADLLYLDLRAAVLKGIIIGLLCFGIFVAVIQNPSFWLYGWHWVIAVAATIGLGILFGSEITLIILVLGMVIISLVKIAMNPFLLPLLLLFMIGGILIRGLMELFPQKTTK